MIPCPVCGRRLIRRRAWYACSSCPLVIPDRFREYTVYGEDPEGQDPGPIFGT